MIHTNTKVTKTIFLLSGESGAGKSWAKDELLKTPDLDVRSIVSRTSRQEREGEINGVDYFFSNDYQINEKINDASQIFFSCGNVYFSTFGDIEKLFKQTDNIVMILTPNSVASFSKKIYQRFGGEVAIKYYHLQVDQEIRNIRMKSRGDSEQSIANRNNNTDNDIKQSFQNYLENGEHNTDLLAVFSDSEAMLQEIKREIVSNGKH